ncbi:2-hydroxyacid dehydrogenase [Olivibacter sitiensis]|uniref:2-hydroxyacid dehydrogenase n=1 Tax=Olivibacter sitiensis TaxID=376470 RepID=UPI00042870B9|nr:D-glycerate dehydrogenase [Olivibacter sitiensis]
MKVFIDRKIPEVGLEKLKAAHIEIEEWTENRELSKDELINYCQQSDAFLSAGSNSLDADFLDQCSHLKVIALHSVGYDRVDIEKATELGIPIGNTPGVLSKATADIAFLLMLSVSRKAIFLHQQIKNDQWHFTQPTDNLGVELEGKILGIFGLGSIGFELARKAKAAFDMKIIYHNRGHNEQAEKELDAKRVSFEDLLSQSDVLSAHAALTTETKGKFDMDTFKKMRKNTIFINTSRGGVHREEDLIAALQQGIIWGAGLDVTNPEPMAADNPLLDMPTVAVFPHIGSQTVETRDQMALMAAENIIAALEGRKIPTCVNKEIYNS